MSVLLAASIALVRRPAVLLIQRNRPPAEGLWTLPGGRLEPGETAEDCVRRELREELGLTAWSLRPLIVLRHGRFSLQTFATEAFEGDVVPDPAEVRDWRWIEPVQAERLPTTPGLGRVLAAAFRIFDRT